MPDEKSLFQTTGPTWAERARLGGLCAILMQPNMRGNLFLHGINTFGATHALKYFPKHANIIDFGCGTGRFTRFFASHYRRVLATEITAEMLKQAEKDCGPNGCEFVLTDGVSLPSQSGTIGGIWCCGVLRYSLFVPNPAYVDIAKEMYRVLRPGAYVVNCEMYVDVTPDVFLSGFEAAGFRTRDVRVIHRYREKQETTFSHPVIPNRLITASAFVSAFIRSHFDNPRRITTGLRDYLFVWQKPVDAQL
jgi:SAM-dependent methyltransferase